MSWWQWALATWLPVALIFGLMIGPALRRNTSQYPRPGVDDPTARPGASTQEPQS